MKEEFFKRGAIGLEEIKKVELQVAVMDAKREKGGLTYVKIRVDIVERKSGRKLCYIESPEWIGVGDVLHVFDIDAMFKVDIT